MRLRLSTSRELSSRKSLVQDDVAYLINEIQILKELDHPNIVKLFDLKEDEDKLYMVLEHMAGGSLETRLVDDRFLPEEEVYSIVKSLVDAMEFCHSRSIVHRDLKVDQSDAA